MISQPYMILLFTSEKSMPNLTLLIPRSTNLEGGFNFRLKMMDITSTCDWCNWARKSKH